VSTYEFGVRSSHYGDDVNLSANLFFNDYDGYQALSSTRFIINMEKVETYGLEIEAVARPAQNLELSAGLGLLQTDIKDAGVQYAVANGNELNSAPKVTANIGAKYWFSNGFNVGASMNFVDEFYGDFLNTPERVAGGYTLTRLTANYVNANWQVSAFVNNAFDEDEYLNREPASARDPIGYVSIVDPRNAGVSVTYSF